MLDEVETERLKLVPFTVDHLPGFHRIWTEERSARWSSRGVSKSLEETTERMKGIITSPEKPDILNHAVYLKPYTGEPDTMISVLGVFRITLDDGCKTGELGYQVHPDHWGKGYATEALKAFLLKFWVLRPDVAKVKAITDPQNFGSQKVLKKNGFKEVEHELEGIVLPMFGPEKRPPPLMFELERPKII